jgi:uncharacterized protein (TIRG00374 family)
MNIEHKDFRSGISWQNPTIRFVKHALGYLVALFSLIWVFHDISFSELVKTMINVHFELTALAICFEILSYISQGLRWRLLLLSKGDISVLRATQAVYVGLFTNEILPLRIGELVRAYLVSRWLSRKFVSIIPSMAVERLFDSVWLALAIGLTAFFVPLPRDLLKSEKILGTIVLIGTGLFLYLVFREEKTLDANHADGRPLWKPIQIVKTFIDRFAMEMKEIGLSKLFYESFCVSFLILFFQIIAFWLVMEAFNLKLSFLAGAVVFVIVHLGTAIPNAPGNVGTYQFFCVVGLSLFGVDKTTATAFSVMVFIILTIPLLIIGLIALGRTGMSLTEIRGEINNAFQAVKTSENSKISKI